MKNILFATTALVATAGIASADVSFSGSANLGLLEVDGAAAAALVSNTAVKATLSAESDNGLTFGTSLTFRHGDDLDLDAGDLTNGGALGATSPADIFISGAFGKLNFDRDGIDNIHNDGVESHDVRYDDTFGDLALTVTADIDDATSTGAAGEEWAVKAVYTTGAVKVTAATDDGSESDVTLAYTLSDMIGLSVNYDTNGQGAESETIVKATYKNDGVSAHIALADDDDDAWEVMVGYTAGAMTFKAVIAENDGAGDTETDVSASYNLGGGMTIKAATNESGAYYLGTALAF